MGRTNAAPVHGMGRLHLNPHPFRNRKGAAPNIQPSYLTSRSGDGWGVYDLFGGAVPVEAFAGPVGVAGHHGAMACEKPWLTVALGCWRERRHSNQLVR